MTLEEFLKDLVYKPGSRFEPLKGWSGVAIWTKVYDAYAPEKMTKVAQLSYLPEITNWTERQFLTWIRDEIRDLEIHEVDEFLIYNGERPFNPHGGEGVFKSLDQDHLTLETFMDHVTYKPGWTLEACFRDNDLAIRCHGVVPNAYDPSKTMWFGTMPRLPKGFEMKSKTSERDFLDWLRGQLKMFETHEMDEWITYKGERPFDPHNQEYHDAIAGKV